MQRFIGFSIILTVGFLSFAQALLAQESLLKYEIVELKHMKKGGQLEPLIRPKYDMIRVSAAISEKGKEITEGAIKSTLSDIVITVRNQHKPDAITAYLFESKAHVGGSLSLGRGEWWPKGHSLAPDNEGNIRDKSTYVFTIDMINVPKKVNPQETITRLTEEQRRQIFTELVKAEDRATIEAEQKYPTDVDKIPMDKLRNYDFEGMFNKKFGREKKLKEKYQKEIMRKYKIDEKEKRNILSEASKENWPLPKLKT